MKLVEITWDDAATCNELLSVEDAIMHIPARSKTVGYLVSDHKDRVVLAMTQYPRGEFDPPEGVKGLWIIPTGCIKEVKELYGEMIE